MESCASAWTAAARSIERCVTVSRSKDIHRTFLSVWKQSSNITQLFFLWKFLTLQYFHIFEFSSSSCLFGFGRFRCALVFLILILGLFGSQPPFAKPKFGSHSLVGMCLVFATLWLATLYCPYGPLVIETIFLPTFAKVWRPISQPHLCGLLYLCG